MKIQRWTSSNKKVYKLKKIRYKENREKEGLGMEVVERYCTVAESLRTSLQQMQEIRKGNSSKKSWREVREELKKEKQGW